MGPNNCQMLKQMGVKNRHVNKLPDRFADGDIKDIFVGLIVNIPESQLAFLAGKAN